MQTAAFSLGRCVKALRARNWPEMKGELLSLWSTLKDEANLFWESLEVFFGGFLVFGVLLGTLLGFSVGAIVVGSVATRVFSGWPVWAVIIIILLSGILWNLEKLNAPRKTSQAEHASTHGLSRSETWGLTLLAIFGWVGLGVLFEMFFDMGFLGGLGWMLTALGSVGLVSNALAEE